ncbi:MAG: hypothetical protein AAFO84_01740 [Cyanobacteria bacterium J06598_1]
MGDRLDVSQSRLRLLAFAEYEEKTNGKTHFFEKTTFTSQLTFTGARRGFHVGSKHFLWLPRCYGYLDENDVLQDSLFLPLGAIAIMLGLAGFFFLAIKAAVRIARR